MNRLAKYLPGMLICGVVTVSAQPDPGGTPAPAPQAPAPTRSLTIEEMRQRAPLIGTDLDADSKAVIHLRDVARRQKDVIKLNCVNDRLVQVKAQRNIADDLRAQLDDALARNADERTDLFQRYSDVGANVSRLREEAQACVGGPDLLKQESGTDVDRPVILDDPTLDPFDDVDETGTGVEPPGYASPFS